MSVDSFLGRLFQPAVSRSLEAWRVGRLTVHFPDGTARTFGPATESLHSTLWIEDPAAIKRFVLGGDLGAGEAYMDGQWRTDDLARFTRLALLNQQALVLDTPVSKLLNVGNDLRHLLRRNTRRGSRRNVRDHYDLSNELFALFLDETMTYSSAVFESDDQPLAEAQRGKYRLMAEKAHLGRLRSRARDRLRLGRLRAVRRPDLRLPCHWPHPLRRAARARAPSGCRGGLEDRIEIRLQDYRDVAGQFDKIVSIEMFEALGLENWTGFFRKCEEVLAPEAADGRDPDDLGRRTTASRPTPAMPTGSRPTSSREACSPPSTR